VLTWPLTLRLWQVGDRFRPLGMTGHKLVSDLLNDRKLSTTDRANTWVLLSADGQIAWVVGHRLAHDFGLSAVTKRVARLLVRPVAPKPDAN
jgi:tRNA(Ile)-lysidine synthase